MPNSKRLTSVLLCSAALVMAGSLAGCGSGEDAIAGAAGKPNSFPPNKNPANNFADQSENDSDNAAGLEPNEIVISLEVPKGESGEGEDTRRGLKIVEPDSIEIYRTDQTLGELESVAYSRRTDDSDRSIITFDEGAPDGPDVVIEARYNGQRLRALATDQDDDVKINPFSEYLVANAVGKYTSGEFSEVMACMDEDADFCLNRYVWAVLADQVHDFEITIPDNMTITQAGTFLANRADFRSFIANMADYARLGPTESDRIDIEDGVDTNVSSVDYNSVWFGLSLAESRWPNGNSRAGQWGAYNATEESSQNTTPSLSLNVGSFFGIDLTLLGSDIPYLRQTYEQAPGNVFDYNTEWSLNSHSTPQAPGTVAQNRLLAGRSVFQTVIGEGTLTGWTRNPYFYDAFLGFGNGQPHPERVLAGYFTGGKAIRLRDRSGGLEREQTLENHFQSVIEINLEQLPQDQSISLGNEYNAVFFGAQQSLSGETVTFKAGYDRLEGGSGATYSFTSTNTSTSSAIHQIVRDTSGAVIGSQADGGVDVNLSVIEEGRFNSGSGMGAIAPSGSLFAINLTDTPLGNGILIAAEPSDSAPASGRYRMQGFVAGQDSLTNTLIHFDNATLEFTSGVNAEADLSAFRLTNVVTNGTVTGPTEAFPSPQDSMSVGAVSGDGFFKLNSGSTDLEMTGFASEDQSQLFFAIRYTVSSGSGDDREYIGLAIATLDERPEN